MHINLLTREYPPEIYGGAGVHVAELVRALRAQLRVTVHAFGEMRSEPDTVSYPLGEQLVSSNTVLQTLAIDVAMVANLAGGDLVHSHTWYVNEAGRLAAELWGIPHVITAHSLEPLRPWKAEQLGGGYRVSRDLERRAYESAAAIISVSNGMRADVLRCYSDVDPARVVTIHNGVDTERWVRRNDPAVWAKFGIEPGRRTVVFVGRITRQKGLIHLLRAARLLHHDVQLVIVASAPDTPELFQEIDERITALSRERGGVVWIRDQLAIGELCAVLSAATVFACPSLYEPLGIVNLEAMSIGLPVVATKTGGIPEVVVDGVTGSLVPIKQRQDGSGTPDHPEEFEATFAAALENLLDDPNRAVAMGRAGRARAAERFSWPEIARRTIELYRSVVG